MENSNFKKGDKVVCINATFNQLSVKLALNKHLITFPKFMEIYTIRGFYDQSIYLMEIVNQTIKFEPDQQLIEPSFYKWRFVKLLSAKAEEKEVCVLENINS